MDVIYQENDNLNQEAIEAYMKLSDEELDNLLNIKLKEAGIKQ
jgi:hypothetical protein